MASLKLGLYATIVGMGGIFLVLAILAAVTMFVGKVVDASISKKEEAKKAAASGTVPAPIVEDVEDIAAVSGIRPQTVAAIMAAVTAAAGGGALKFKSIRRTGRITNSWTSASNYDIINNRQQYL